VVEATGGAASLAKRLRELRVSHFPEAKLTQAQLAKALSGDEKVGISTLSAWENTVTVTLPPPDRLRTYARFFATARSVEPMPPRLIPLADLTPEEDRARERLESELFRLRGEGAGEAPAPLGSWQFPDEAPITIICSDLSRSDEVKLGPLSDEDNPNYTELYSYADLDALVGLYGHLCSSNPRSPVRYRLGSEARSGDLTNHLVLLGGIAWNDITRRLNDSVDLPVRQRQNEKIHSGEVFEITTSDRLGEQFLPRWKDDPGTPDKPGVLLEDVGMLARLPNPFNVNRTLTYCNGIHSRGVLGAVKCLTDPGVRDQNEEYLEETFGGSNRFVILMRVAVLGSRTISPSLNNPGAVLFNWPNQTPGN
jgi:hypothetical protein